MCICFGLILTLFWLFVMYVNEFETTENSIWTKDKIEPQHICYPLVPWLFFRSTSHMDILTVCYPQLWWIVCTCFLFFIIIFFSCLAQLKIEEITRMLRTGELGIPDNPDERYILQTVSYTSAMVLTRIIRWTSFFMWWSIVWFSWPQCLM